MAEPVDPKVVAFAEASGIEPYRRYNEPETAVLLDVSKPTLKRLRATGRISFVRISPRRIRFFGFQIAEYLLNALEAAPCRDIQKNNTPSKSAISGSPSGKVVPRGIEHGSTAPLGKQSALALAQMTFQKRSGR